MGEIGEPLYRIREKPERERSNVPYIVLVLILFFGLLLWAGREYGRRQDAPVFTPLESMHRQPDSCPPGSSLIESETGSRCEKDGRLAKA